MTAVALPTGAAGADGPTLTSDQSDYAPGSVVTLTGAGWQAGETVNLTVDDSSGQTWHYSDTPIADSTGSFTDQFVLPDWFVATYTATATDGTATASTTFTDSNVQVRATNGSAVAVSIGWTVYRKTTNCTGSTQTIGTSTTPSSGSGFTGTSGLGNSFSESLLAPATITVGTELYAFSSWSGPVNSGANPVCIPGDATNGTIKETANYVDAGRATKLQQTITFGLLNDVTFGAPDFTVSATASSGLAVSFTAAGQCTISGNTVHITAAGSCSITATQAGNATYYAATPVTRSFAINPAGITVTVSGSQVYGGAPNFSETNNAPSGVTLSGSPACTGLTGSPITTTVAVGSYTIDGTTCSGLTPSDPNYSITYVGSTFTVTPAPIAVTVTGTSVYGDPPSFATTVLPAGVTGTVTCPDTTDPFPINTVLPVGTYTIDAIHCTGLSTDSNHTVQYVNGSYIVTQRDLAVLVSGSQTYGDSSASFTGTIASTPGVTFDSTGLTCTSVDGGTPITRALPVAGPHTVDAASCTGGSLSGTNAGNYHVVFGSGGFTVVPAQLNAQVSGTQVYGDAPTWSATYTGFVNGETASVLSGGFGCMPTSTALNAGTYAITGCPGLPAAANYVIVPTLGSLVVTQRLVTVTVSGTQVYGGSPTWTPDYSGTAFVNGDTSAMVDDSGLTCAPVDPTLSVAGNPHPISGCTGITALDYSFTIIPGSLTVTPKPITVHVDGAQVYGGAPTYTPDYTHTQFANGETPSVVTGSLTCSTTATATSPVGTYPISTCAGLASPNYTISYDLGTVTVSKKPITVVVNGSQTYGGTGISYTPDYTGVAWVGSDGPSVVSGPTGCTTNATASSPVGSSYTVTGCTLTATNYDITTANGRFTVTPAHLTVSADNQSMTYGDPIPSLTATVSGFVLGQNLASSGVTGSASCGTTYTSSMGAGTYPITCSKGSLAAANYDFTTFNPGTLTVSTRAATLGFTGSLFWSTGSTTATTANVTLQGVITPSGGTPDLTKATVVFELFKSTNMTAVPDLTCPATATSSGQFTCNVTLGLDNWTVVMHMTAPGTSYFSAPDSDPVVLTVYQPATDKFATGGGWVVDPSAGVSPSNKHGNFGFTVRYKSGTTPSGQAVYTWRGSDGYDYVVKSNSWTGGGLSFGTNSVSFSAKANVTVFNRATGAIVSSAGNYTFRVDAVDNGSPSTNDTYAISVYTPTGALYHQAGTTAAQLLLGGGNVVVHTK